MVSMSSRILLEIICRLEMDVIDNNFVLFVPGEISSTQATVEEADDDDNEVPSEYT